MGKDNVLGHDPLGWMKVTKEEKKSFPVTDGNEENPNSERGDQKANHQTATAQQLSNQKTRDALSDNVKVSQFPGKVAGMKVDSVPDNTPAPKHKVVIGRLYEKPSPEKGKPIQRSEGIVQESKSYSEPPLPGSRVVQPIRRNDPEIHRVSPAVSSDRFSSYIIIAYTALLLILGYFVYQDLSKRTGRVEARLFAIEKALHVK